MCFVNKMDRIGRQLRAREISIKEAHQGNAVAIHLPIGAEDKHRGVVDLVRMKALVFDEDEHGRQKYEEQDIPADMLDEATSTARSSSRRPARSTTRCSSVPRGETTSPSKPS
jgi:elongation factor G